MTKFVAALGAWRSDGFGDALNREIRDLGTGVLPLASGVLQGGIVDGSSIRVTILRLADDDRAVHVEVGVFFTEVVGGCSCGDEPYESPAWCRLRISIDKATAEAEIVALTD